MLRAVARPADMERVLTQSAVAVSGAADTNENALATITLPGGTMGLSGSIRIYAQFTYTNSANNKTLRVRFGGAGGTSYFALVATTSAYAGCEVWISNRGAANSQVGGANGLSSFRSTGTSGVTASTSAVDTDADVSIVITGQKASAGETLTLERYMVEVLP